MKKDSVAEALHRSVREPEAFLRLYDEHARSLLAFLARRVYDAEVALDLTAETFAQAYAGRHRFRGATDAAAASWLYTIARRQLSRYLRRGRLERRALSRLGITVSPLTEEETARIEEIADVRGLRALIRAELERLSRSQREALRLRLIDELPYPTMAKRLGISQEAARARVSRGLRTLARRLEGAISPEEVP